MSDYARQLENKIKEKNRLIHYYSQKQDIDESKVKHVEAELDSLLYKYYKATLKEKTD
ncbi:MAG TPA: hypothetical protein PK033_00750 [Acetivibrio sp.]|nr:hypothetical protein [Clostridium sp.]HPT91218.1 hypothetical protein [Acetivibrio sp.]HQA56398.1 hypothetical protein [Acetivibrio sp.]